ncbi:MULTISPECIES: accessory gene regulator ArgB-like protein [Caproicibacterium]|uniref:Accessory gene regulator B family protein n=1 Tax=Caproicibacterium argilliputei TaxID=3030016 RepID=A0AA97D9D4_9FIRM|nr:accessory gene regulator B family protein [Caproicibacterium argilliputei]WOC32666.1 accessory gene regulator B family protein [Caproicibacterium argilliputei]
MEKQLSYRIAEKLVKYGAVTQENCETYAYGISLMLNACLHIATTVVIGAAFHMLSECLLFYLGFAVLRRFAGGYHAGSPAKCYLLSCLVVAAVLLVVKYIEAKWTVPVDFVLVFLCGISVLQLAPVEDANKPLDSEEIRHYKRTSRLLWLAETAAAAGLAAAGLQRPAFALCLAQAVLAGMLLFGSVKNRRRSVQAV